VPLPTPKSLQDFIDDFLQSWAVITGVTDVDAIPETDPIVAIAGSNSGASLYLQSLVYQLEAFSRASTAVGPDLDSWFAQFSYTDANGVFHGFERPLGSPASVSLQVTIQIPVGAPNVVIPALSIFQTQSITVQPASVPMVFQVQTTQDYVFTSSGTYAIQCYAFTPITTTDTSGNSVTGYAIYNGIPPNQFTQQFSPISGVNAVTNAAAPTSGTNNASDSQARIDFINWILSLSDATYQALVAAIEDVAGGLVPGQTFELYDYASAPTFCQPGMISAVVIGPGSGQYPGANADNPTMDAIGQALINTEAFGIVGVEYYAAQYAITAISATYTYSQSALTQANLTVAGLQNLMTAILQALIPSSGANLGQLLYFSTLVQQWRNLSVTLSGGVITGIVTDVDALDFSATTTGGTFNQDLVQPGTPSELDPSGYLSLADTVVPAYIAHAAP
jgi:hypothetical protein